MLQGAGVVAASTLLPVGRGGAALATPQEPCYKSCRADARRAWIEAEGSCGTRRKGNVVLAYGGFQGLFPFLATVGSTLIADYACNAKAELDWHAGNRQCAAASCGDADKYPGGNAPGVACEPGYEIQCGDICCNATGNPECCVCPKTGLYQCCANGSKCGCCG